MDQAATPFTSDDLLYDIVSSASLPTIDISRSVRSLLFSEGTVNRLNRLISKSRRPLFIIYVIAAFICAIGLFGPAWVGRWLAIPGAVGTSLGMIVQVLVMRYDILCLLLVTYEFWFFSTVMLSSYLLFALYLSDLRVLIVVAMWLGTQVNIMIDASTAIRESILVTSLGIVVNATLICLIAIDGIDETNNFPLLAVNGRRISARDFIVNGLSTGLVLFMRNVYRRRTALRDHGSNSTVVQCLSYKCRVRLRGRTRRRSGSSLSSGSSVSSVSSVQMTRPTASYFQNAKMVQMRCMRVKIKFDARHLVAPFARQFLEHPDPMVPLAWRFPLFVVMDSGVFLTVVSFIPGTPTWCCFGALAATLIFCCVSVLMYHRKLLRYLVFSFDFAFLSVQFSVLAWGMCDLYRWDARSYALAASWLWVHWVLTFDCIPPAIKSKWRFRYRLIMWIVVLFVLAHCAIAYQIAFGRREGLRDRALYTFTSQDRLVEVRVLPLLGSRMMMTFGWSCRIAWRLFWRSENELIVIQGTVTYINNRRKLKEQQARAALKQPSVRKSMVRQLTRRLSNTALAFASSVVPLSIDHTETSLGHELLGPSILRTENARLTIVAGRLYDAATGSLPVQPRSLSSRPGLSKFESIGPLFEAVGVPPRQQDPPQIESRVVTAMVLTSVVSMHSDPTAIDNSTGDGDLKEES